jgi:hypothetical protein
MKKFLLLALLVFALSGCGGGSTKGLTPSKTIETFYSLANEGKYSELEKYFSATNLNIIKSLGSVQSVCDSMTKNCTVEKIEIVSEKIVGEGATVDVKVNFNNEIMPTTNKTLKLIKENGVWKINN